MVRHPSTTVLVKLYGLQHGNCNPVESENISMSGENNIYYIDMIFTHGFIRCEKPFHDLFLTNVNQSESKRFFHTCENRFVQSAGACFYILANSFTTGKIFGEDFLA